MHTDYLEFEQPIAELEEKIKELRLVGSDNKLNITEEIEKLQEKSRKLTTKIFSSLSPWQVSMLARHPMRPQTEDYVRYMCTDFQELHGDRLFADDQSIIGGVAYLDDIPVMIIEGLMTAFCVAFFQKVQPDMLPHFNPQETDFSCNRRS